MKTMTRGFGLGLLVAVASATAQAPKAPAQKIDVAKLSCKDLMAGNDADREAGIAYYQGYFAGRKGAQVLDVQAVAEHSDRLADHCLSNPTSLVMDAFTKTAR
jgi:hypothetical protein